VAGKLVSHAAIDADNSDAVVAKTVTAYDQAGRVDTMTVTNDDASSTITDFDLEQHRQSGSRISTSCQSRQWNTGVCSRGDHHHDKRNIEVEAMSEAYYLICMDTGECLSMGSISHVNAGQPGWYTIDKIGFDARTPEMLRDSAIKNAGLVHFLLRNRGRELRLLPEAVYQRYGSNFFPTTSSETTIPIDPPDYEQLFALPLGQPNARDVDLEVVPQKALDRLAELSRGENIEKLPWDQPTT
jgi:hypothetical protein